MASNETAKQGKKKGLWAKQDTKGKMLITLIACAAALIISIGIALALIMDGTGGVGGILNGATAETADSLVTEKGYDKNQNTIDTTVYETTILGQTDDAGQSYVDSTLFLGDSNTARMYRMFDYCSYDNACGSVGLSASSLANFACVQFSGYNGYQTMPQAVALMQPQRVILTFGTNDLNPNQPADKFIELYKAGIVEVQNAYPTVDIIVNSIPPLGKEHSNASLSQAQVDEYNKAIVQMCQDNGWKYLNSAEVLKDSSSGYAKSGYTETSDGIHLTQAAMDAMFEYVRTHSYITEDDRPELTAVPKHTGDKDVVVYTAPIVATPAPATEAVPEETPAPEETIPEETPAPEQSYTYWTEVISPTCTDQGYTVYHCNEDSTKDYTSDYTNPLGHDFQGGSCTRCGADDPDYSVATPEPTPEPAPEPAPVETPTPTPEVIQATETPAPTSDNGGTEWTGEGEPPAT